MRILLTTVLALTVVGAVASRSTLLAGGQSGQGGTTPTMSHPMPMAGKPMATAMTKDQKITNATSAAPSTVSAKATILDWPSKEGEAPAVLRPGTNGWTCFPDMRETEGNDPMCLDKPWMQWAEGYMTHRAPQVTGVGIGYMLALGGGWGSNTDPYAMTMTPDNQWHLAMPHLMIVLPDTKSLSGISTDPKNGGPYVMFPGTPYAHVMAPVTTGTMSGRSN